MDWFFRGARSQRCIAKYRPGPGCQTNRFRLLSPLTDAMQLKVRLTTKPPGPGGPGAKKPPLLKPSDPGYWDQNWPEIIRGAMLREKDILDGEPPAVVSDDALAGLRAGSGLEFLKQFDTVGSVDPGGQLLWHCLAAGRIDVERCRQWTMDNCPIDAGRDFDPIFNGRSWQIPAAHAREFKKGRQSAAIERKWRRTTGAGAAFDELAAVSLRTVSHYSII